MGLFSFIKNAGKKLGIGGDDDAPDVEAVKKELASHDLGTDKVDVAVEGDKVVLTGVVKDQSAFEKAVVAVGNTLGISKVEAAELKVADGAAAPAPAKAAGLLYGEEGRQSLEDRRIAVRQGQGCEEHRHLRGQQADADASGQDLSRPGTAYSGSGSGLTMKRLSAVLPVFPAVATAACGGPALAEAFREPGKGSAERAAILDTLRPAVEAEMRGPVEFVVTAIRASPNWAFVQVEPQRPGGGVIDPEETGFAGESDMMDGLTVYGLTTFQSGGWNLDRSHGRPDGCRLRRLAAALWRAAGDARAGIGGFDAGPSCKGIRHIPGFLDRRKAGSSGREHSRHRRGGPAVRAGHADAPASRCPCA